MNKLHWAGLLRGLKNELSTVDYSMTCADPDAVENGVFCDGDMEEPIGGMMISRTSAKAALPIPMLMRKEGRNARVNMNSHVGW